jgi:hypothetical protein
MYYRWGEHPMDTIINSNILQAIANRLLSMCALSRSFVISDNKPFL